MSNSPSTTRLSLVVALVLLLPLLLEGTPKGKGTKKSRATPKAAVAGSGTAERGDGRSAPGQIGVAADGVQDSFETYDQFCGAALVEKGTGNVDQAVQLLGSSISQLPNISVGWLELGSIFGAVGDTQLAHRCLRSAARLDGQDKGARSLIHEIRSRGQLPPITPSIELESNAADPAAEHQARYKRRLYERYYMLDCRMRRMRQVLNLRPQDVAALLGAAEVSSELLYHRQAVDMLQRALEVAPSNGAVFVKLVEAQVKGCVFAGWDDNFKRLEHFILQQAAAGKPVVLGPIQSTMYPLPPNVGLAICRQAGDLAHATFLNSHLPPLSHPTNLSPPLGSTNGGGGGGFLGSLWGGAGIDSSWRSVRGRLVIGYVTSHFTSSSIGREMLFLLGSHSEQVVVGGWACVCADWKMCACVFCKCVYLYVFACVYLYLRFAAAVCYE